MEVMFLQNHQNSFRIAVLSALAIFFAGCDPAKPTVYEIPKEDRSPAVIPEPGQNTSPAAGTTQMQILPGMQESANSAPEISYDVPATWKELEPSGIRKANFTIHSDGGSAEVTVLTFPGDVGGTLANINRWRKQIGLAPATAESINAFSEPCEIAGHKGLYVRLAGDSQSILGAVLPFHGNTWFFKMLGDTPVVRANDATMKQFLNTVRFVDHAHR